MYYLLFNIALFIVIAISLGTVTNPTAVTISTIGLIVQSFTVGMVVAEILITRRTKRILRERANENNKK